MRAHPLAHAQRTAVVFVSVAQLTIRASCLACTRTGQWIVSDITDTGSFSPLNPAIPIAVGRVASVPSLRCVLGSSSIACVTRALCLCGGVELYYVRWLLGAAPCAPSLCVWRSCACGAWHSLTCALRGTRCCFARSPLLPSPSAVNLHDAPVLVQVPKGDPWFDPTSTGTRVSSRWLSARNARRLLHRVSSLHLLSSSLYCSCRAFANASSLLLLLLSHALCDPR